jgi:hypothetical protein
MIEYDHGGAVLMNNTTYIAVAMSRKGGEEKGIERWWL